MFGFGSKVQRTTQGMKRERAPIGRQRVEVRQPLEVIAEKIDAANEVEELLKHPGWKRMQAELLKRRDALTEILKKDDQVLRDNARLIEVRSQIREVEVLLAWPETVMKRGLEALQEAEKYRKEHGNG